MKGGNYEVLSGALYFTCQDLRLFLKRIKRENQCFDHYSQSRGIIIEDCRVFHSKIYLKTLFAKLYLNVFPCSLKTCLKKEFVFWVSLEVNQKSYQPSQRRSMCTRKLNFKTSTTILVGIQETDSWGWDLSVIHGKKQCAVKDREL